MHSPMDFCAVVVVHGFDDIKMPRDAIGGCLEPAEYRRCGKGQSGRGGIKMTKTANCEERIIEEKSGRRRG